VPSFQAHQTTKEMVGWPLSFLLTRLVGSLKDRTGSLTWSISISVGLLIILVILARVNRRPVVAEE
jgi:hypothetical protein